jgi:CRISPR-associated protein Csx16
MSHYFISRHKGAIDWAKNHLSSIELTCISHLETDILEVGDVVYGTLPVHIAQEVCAKGCQYFHLTLDTPEYLRGEELTAEDMKTYGACLEEYSVVKV